MAEMYPKILKHPWAIQQQEVPESRTSQWRPMAWLSWPTSRLSIGPWHKYNPGAQVPPAWDHKQLQKTQQRTRFSLKTSPMETIMSMNEGNSQQLSNGLRFLILSMDPCIIWEKMAPKKWSRQTKQMSARMYDKSRLYKFYIYSRSFIFKFWLCKGIRRSLLIPHKPSIIIRLVNPELN